MPELKKKLTLYGLTMIAVGSCIGSGIFITPYQIVEAVPHHGLVILVWMIGGLIALTGALTFAELGAMFPQSGGVYIYLKEAYGDLVAFLYGWVILLVINTGALAALSIGFTKYLSFFIPLSDTSQQIVAIFTLLGLTTINIFGVQLSQLLASSFTSIKLLVMLGIIVVGFIYYDAPNVSIDLMADTKEFDNLGSALLTALVGVLWSFGGWHHASYLAGETINAKRTVPRAMVLGTMIVTVTYILINLAYMLLLPLDVIVQTERIAGDALASVFSFGAKLAAIGIAISIFGTIGIYTMSAPRIYFAMAKDGIFFKKLSYIHPKYKTPVFAMITQCVWAIILLLFWGTFEGLIKYVTFTDILFMALAGISVFVFRRTKKDFDRPYKVIAYPIVPLIFISISIAFVINTLFTETAQAGAGLLLLALGLPFYYLFKKYNR